jgi:calpain-15
MPFKDFCKQFDSLDVCRVRNWEEVRIRGRFIRYQDGNNPTVEVVHSKWIYALYVPKKSHVIITLYQAD